MTRPRNSAIAVTLLLALLAGGAACRRHGHGIDAGDLIALRHAENRRLVVSNGTARPLTLLGARDRPAAEPQVIPPGQSFAILFDAAQVVRAGQTVRSPRGYWTDGGQKFTLVEPQAATPYFEMSGPDMLVRLKVGTTAATSRADLEQWEFRVEVGACVYDPMPPGGYRLNITGEPDPTTPLSLCRSPR